MAKLGVYAEYRGWEVGKVDLPEGHDYAAIREWYVKWGMFNYTVDNVTWHECSIVSDTDVDLDYKRPIMSSLHPIDDKGEVNLDIEHSAKH